MQIAPTINKIIINPKMNIEIVQINIQVKEIKSTTITMSNSLLNQNVKVMFQEMRDMKEESPIIRRNKVLLWMMK